MRYLVGRRLQLEALCSLVLAHPIAVAAQGEIPARSGTTFFVLDLAGTPLGEIPTAIKQLKGMMEVVLKDGVPMDLGAVRLADHSMYAWPQTPPRGRGTYTLSNHTLRLAYDGGPELRMAFPGLEDGSNSSPRSLRLGWNLDLLARR